MPRVKVALDGREYLVEYVGTVPMAVRVVIPATERRATPWDRKLWARCWGISPRGRAKRAIELAQERRAQDKEPGS